jgi:hypothetical protein
VTSRLSSLAHEYRENAPETANRLCGVSATPGIAHPHSPSGRVHRRKLTTIRCSRKSRTIDGIGRSSSPSICYSWTARICEVGCFASAASPTSRHAATRSPSVRRGLTIRGAAREAQICSPAPTISKARSASGAHSRYHSDGVTTSCLKIKILITPRIGFCGRRAEPFGTPCSPHAHRRCSCMIAASLPRSSYLSAGGEP